MRATSIPSVAKLNGGLPSSQANIRSTVSKSRTERRELLTQLTDLQNLKLLLMEEHAVSYQRTQKLNGMRSNVKNP